MPPHVSIQLMSNPPLTTTSDQLNNFSPQNIGGKPIYNTYKGFWLDHAPLVPRLWFLALTQLVKCLTFMQCPWSLADEMFTKDLLFCQGKMGFLLVMDFPSGPFHPRALSKAFKTEKHLCQHMFRYWSLRRHRVRLKAIIIWHIWMAFLEKPGVLISLNSRYHPQAFVLRSFTP